MHAPVRNRVMWYRVALVLMVALGLALGGSQLLQELGAVKAAPVTITDDLGRKITLPRTPKRIISIAPSNTEILFALGLGDKVIGVTDSCDYPEAAKSKPKVGSVDLNYEKIIEMAPDLVVAVGSLQRQGIERLSMLGITVLAVDPKTINGVLHAIELIGKATDVEDRATTLVAKLSNRIEAVKARVAGAGASAKPRVFVEIWNDPLMTAGPGTFIDELISAAGGENIAHDARGEWPQFSAEAVIKRDPEVVILTGFNKAEALARPAWQGISAYRLGRVHEVHPDLLVRPGPRLVQGLEELAKILHPEAFK